MGLPARQRRVLDRIEAALRGSDPKLAALYSMFTRLNASEEMPKLEQLTRSARILIRAIWFRLGHCLARVLGRLAPRQRAAILFPLALAMTITAVVFAVRLTPGPRCTPVATAANGPKTTDRSNLCPIQMTTFSGK